MKLILATHNRDKVLEIQSKLSETGFDILSLDDLASLPEVEETAETLEGNALKKARETYDALKYSMTDFIVLADDTGLEVDALGGKPGVFSARYASVNGKKPTYEENVAKLLFEMSKEKNRSARFRTVIALVGNVNGNLVEQLFEGKAEGLILNDRRGNSGFGYDPIFFVEILRKSFAELTLEEKNQISHRAHALVKSITYLKSFADSLKKNS